MILVFDTETTGKADFALPAEHEKQPRLVQLGAILMDEVFIVRGEINLIVQPVGFEIPKEAAAIHGITTEIATKYGHPEKEVLARFFCMVAMAEKTVAHNHQFDALIIKRACKVNGIEHNGLPRPYDTMLVMTEICKIPSSRGYKWPSLQEAYFHCFKQPFEGAHDAMADVRACADIYKWLNAPVKPVVPKSTPKPVESDDYNDSTLMPFGKYKGTPLGKLDDNYVAWLYEQERLSDERLYQWLHGKK